MKGELNLGELLSKCASVTATTLRHRPLDEKAAIVAEVATQLWPLVEAGTVRPIVHEVLPVERAADAHRLLEESGEVFGKLILKMP
jgi:NADPH:quinone reductase-like Zn-dependent oxidoreductase